MRSLSECSEGIVLVDVHTPRWPLLFATDHFRDLADLRRSPTAEDDAFFWDEFSLLAPDGVVSKASTCSAGCLNRWLASFSLGTSPAVLQLTTLHREPSSAKSSWLQRWGVGKILFVTCQPCYASQLPVHVRL